MMKFFIAKVDFEPELGKRQPVFVLLNEKNELPSADSAEEMEAMIGQSIEVGKQSYEDGGRQYYFANIAKKDSESMPVGWKFVSDSDMKSIDGAVVIEAIEQLGYNVA